MVDTVTPEKRSQVMASVKQKNTKPEKRVRSYLHACGLRFRLHEKKLPGKPDLVFPKYHTVVFVNGCFWHGHKNCPAHRIPKSNVDFWKDKIESNAVRDVKNHEMLMHKGWNVIVIWECETKSQQSLEDLYKQITQSSEA